MRALCHAFLFRVVVLVDLVFRTVVLDVVFLAAAVVASQALVGPRVTLEHALQSSSTGDWAALA